MRQLLHRSFLPLLVLLTCLPAVTLFAATFNEATHGFAVTVPDGWVQIPKQTLDDYSDMLASRSGGKLNERYPHGYQRGYNGQWLVHPYILVQVKETGRVPDGQLKQMKPFQAGVERSLNKSAQSLEGILSGAKLGETLYDATNHCFWMHFSAEVAGVGPIKAVTCGFLTEKGVILFHCYARTAEFNALLPSFQQVLASVKIADDLKYKPRLGDGAGLDFKKVTHGAFIGGLIGGFVSLIAWLVKKKRHAKHNETLQPPPLP